MDTALLRLGLLRACDGDARAGAFALRPEQLTTHTVVLGMTGSGKTGLLTVLTEEALAAGVPVLLVDLKGDLVNLALTLAPDEPAAWLPWVDEGALLAPGATREALADGLRAQHESSLAQWNLSADSVRSALAGRALRVFTPGSTAGEPLHLLSGLELRSSLWDTAPEQARGALSSALSLALRLVGRDGDPTRSREHVLLSALAERHLREGRACPLGTLVRELETPPLETVGALAVDDFLSPRERHTLAAALNSLLASALFSAWRMGAALDVAAWMQPTEGRTPVTVVSLAHLPEEERTLALGVLLDALLAWVRSLSGTSRLRALLVFDELYGLLPPHPASPPTKKPLVTLLKQARAFGVGMVLATQNPMDLDYRALSNAGLWFLGRLQTDADRARVVEGLSASDGGPGTSAAALSETLKRLGPRWFLARNARAGEGVCLCYPRQALAWLRGPLTPSELRVALGRADLTPAASP